MHFATTNTGYFLFSCLITPQLLEPVCSTPDEIMRVKNARRAFRKRSSIVWDDLYYGILNKDYEWSPLQRCEVFKAMSRGERDGEYIPVVCPEVQPVWRWHLSTADCILLFARVVVSMFELAIIVSLPALVVVGGTRFILLIQAFHKDIDGKALYVARLSADRHELTVFRIWESLRHVYCFLKSVYEHWPWLVWFFDIYHVVADYDLGKCY